MQQPMVQQRPQHHRHKSSKSSILKSLVSSKSGPEILQDDTPESVCQSRSQQVPLLPPDHPHASKAKPLGERPPNAQSPPPSPSKMPKSRPVEVTSQSTSKKGEKLEKTKKTKSSTSLHGMFAKMNKSSKDLNATIGSAEEKGKENKEPHASAVSTADAPIWAQFATSCDKPTHARSSTNDSKASQQNLKDEIAKYTPQQYSPGKQRNFHGGFENPGQPPTLNSRPQSTYNLGGAELFGARGKKVASGRQSVDGRRSEDSARRSSKDHNSRNSMDMLATLGRKVSGSSTEQGPAKENLNVAKRGGRVLAAVAAFQGKVNGKDVSTSKQEPELNANEVDKAFEAVLESRNIPEPMRQKMRTLKLRVKADFVRQDQGTAKSAGSIPLESLTAPPASADNKVEGEASKQQVDVVDDTTSKRSRPRSRTFTFSKADKRSGEASPSKKQRPESKGKDVKARPTSIHIPKDSSAPKPPGPTTPTSASGIFGRKAQTQALPEDFIAYLKKTQDPVQVEVGRLHKLRILLRNETVAWVDSFISNSGMLEIVALLHRTMDVEWREEHEDQLLHETLLCLKGLCTTARALAELEKVADKLFPALIAMIFDEEKKGPAEYSTRTIIFQLLFNYLSATKESNTSSATLECRAQKILAYISEPVKDAEDAKPVPFVLEMRAPRPYKPWCTEVSNVTKEVFWIFLHHLNVVPFSRPSSNSSRPGMSPSTYADRHFPQPRAPVPAAPYIGGVEWDATTYLTAHLDLLNGLIASLPTTAQRNTLRAELAASGFEKVMGGTLRTCKEKFYGGVHDGLRSWAAAALEDGWVEESVRFVREGPTQEEQAERAIKHLNSPGKKGSPKKEAAPQIDAPKLSLGPPRLDLGLGVAGADVKSAQDGGNDDGDDGWLG